MLWTLSLFLNNTLFLAAAGYWKQLEDDVMQVCFDLSQAPSDVDEKERVGKKNGR